MKRIIIFLLLSPLAMTAMEQTINSSKSIEFCKSDQLDQLKALIEKDNTIVDQRDSNEFTLVHFAVLNGSINVLTFLLDSYPHLKNSIDKNGNVPFGYIFIGAAILKIDINKMQIPRNLIRMRLLASTPPLEEIEAIETKEEQQLKNYRKCIDLFITKNADIDQKEHMGYNWREITAQNKELLSEFYDCAETSIQTHKETKRK